MSVIKLVSTLSMSVLVIILHLSYRISQSGQMTSTLQLTLRSLELTFLTLGQSVIWIVMEYIYAALLLHYGKQPITEENIVKVLQAAGITPDEIKVKALVAALKEVNIDEAIKTATVLPAVAAAPAAAAGAPAAEAKPAEEKVAEEKKAEEKKEGPSEEELAAGLASLFG